MKFLTLLEKNMNLPGLLNRFRDAKAGSSRNVPKYSLAGDRQGGRDTDWVTKGRNSQLPCQTPNTLPSQMAGVRAWGKLSFRKGDNPAQG